MLWRGRVRIALSRKRVADTTSLSEGIRLHRMLRFLLLIVASTALGLVFALAAALRRPLVRLFRAVLLGFVILLGVTGLAAGVVGFTSDAWWATAIGGILMLLAAWLGWPLVRRRRPKHTTELEHVPLTKSLPDPRWAGFESSLDWVSRQQARQSRAAIERFLAERASQSLTHEHKALMLSCEKRVPELLDACLDRCRNAKRQERERYMGETLDRLVQIAGEAERARLEIREADDQRLRVLHRYFDGVAGSRDRGPDKP